MNPIRRVLTALAALRSLLSAYWLTFDARHIRNRFCHHCDRQTIRQHRHQLTPEQQAALAEITSAARQILLDDTTKPTLCGQWPWPWSDADISSPAENARVHQARGCCEGSARQTGATP